MLVSTSNKEKEDRKKIGGAKYCENYREISLSAQFLLMKASTRRCAHTAPSLHWILVSPPPLASSELMCRNISSSWHALSRGSRIILASALFCKYNENSMPTYSGAK